MSWFSNLVETYNNVQDIVGIPDKEGNILLSPNHTTKSNSDICVTIDSNGVFRNADQSKLTIPIPCTDDSESRSSGVSPHPLHDQIGYLSTNEKKREKYLSQLANWSGLHPKVEAVRRYVFTNTLIDDLQSCGVKTDEKLFVRFSVEMPGDPTPNLWEDKSVSERWQSYCEQGQTYEKTLCYVTGDNVSVKTKHPKNINPSTGNAKIISCNDKDNFTYRGRFSESEQANAISVNASHKAHAMLKYLIATQGYKCDSQAIVAWGIDNSEAAASPFDNTYGFFDEKPDEKEVLDYNYSENLRNALIGAGGIKRLSERVRRIAVIAIDAATTGRMAVTFYKDLPENEYIERIIKWHETCCWHFKVKGNDGKTRNYVSAPKADRIIAAVYGEPKGEGYSKIKKQARERILSFVLNGEQFDRAWLNSAVNRVSNPFSYAKDKSDGGWDMYKWERAINVTCAVARKYYKDKKEEFSLELERNRNDRDYLYGRMLAVADKIESHARWLQTGKNDTDKRATNAVRYMSAFSTTPFRTWEVIYRQLNPYIQRLNGGEWYQKEIDEIMSLFKEGEYENNKALDGRYLLGYSLQRREYAPNKNNEEEQENAD